MDLKEQGDGIGVSVVAFQPMRGHSLAGLGLVESGPMGGSLRLLKGGMQARGKNRRVDRW